MLSYTLRRFLSALAVLLVVSALTFGVVLMMPGNPAQIILGTDATPEKLTLLEEAMGLDRPWYEQYCRWSVNFIRGEWGNSYVFGEQVRKLILQRLPVTFSITGGAMLLSVLLSALLGTAAALQQGGFIDGLSRTLMQLGVSIPSFWLAMLFMLLFSSRLGWFPVTGYAPVTEGVVPFLKSIALPCVVLAIGEMGILIRIIRSSMLESLKQDYMIGTSIKGLPKALSITKYAMRSAVIAPVTIIALQFAKLLGGTAIIESIFALPGVGRLLLTAVEQRDIVLLQGIVMFITTCVVVISFLTDIIYTIVNPTIRFTKEETG